MWWKLPPGPRRERAKAEAEIGELKPLANHKCNVVEFSNGRRHYLQGSNGWLHPFRNPAEKQAAMLAARAGMQPRQDYVTCRLSTDGRLLLVNSKNRHCEVVEHSSPLAYRIALAKVLQHRPTKSQLKRAKTGVEETNDTPSTA